MSRSKPSISRTSSFSLSFLLLLVFSIAPTTLTSPQIHDQKVAPELFGTSTIFSHSSMPGIQIKDSHQTIIGNTQLSSEGSSKLHANSYVDLWLILTMCEQYISKRNLDFFTVYWNTTNPSLEPSLLRWYRVYGQLIPVRFKACKPPRLKSENAPQNRISERKFASRESPVQGLHLILCDGRYQEKYLQKVVQQSSETSRLVDHWMLVDYGAEQIISRKVFIPLDSMVMKLQKFSSEKIFLTAVWSPVRGIPQKERVIGVFDGSTDSYNLQLSNESKYDYRMDLSGIHFVVTSINDTKAHASKYNTSRDCFVMTGVFGELFELAKSRMNFTYTVRSPADKEFGVKLDNGTWTGIVGDLVAGRADLAVAFLSKTVSRAQVVSYSSTILNFRYRIFSQVPSSSMMHWTAYSRPFTSSLWCVVGLTFFVLSASFILTCNMYSHISRETDKKCQKNINKSQINHSHQNFEKKTSDEAKNQSKTDDIHAKPCSVVSKSVNYSRAPCPLSSISLEEQEVPLVPDQLELSDECEPEEKKLAEWKSVGFLMVWSAFMQQGFPDTPRPAVLRLIFLLSYTVGVLLLASYAATLVSFLTVSSSSLPFDSLSAMAALKDYRLGIQIGSVCEELMLSPSYINLYERLVLPYSDTQDRNFSKLKLRALSDPYFSLLATYEIQRSTHDGSCLLVHSKFDVMYNNGAYAFTRGSHFVPLFNYFIAKVRESGVLQRSILEYYPTQACPDDHDMSVGHTQVFTAFLALGCCSILAVLVVFLECLIRRCTVATKA